MSDRFHKLDNEENIINLGKDYNEFRDKALVSYPMLKLKDLIQSANEKILDLSPNEWRKDDKWIVERKKWIDEGLDAEILNLGDTNWKKGKIRIKVIVEFCPDEPEESDKNETRSPLDDIRQSMTENN